MTITEQLQGIMHDRIERYQYVEVNNESVSRIVGYHNPRAAREERISNRAMAAAIIVFVVGALLAAGLEAEHGFGDAFIATVVPAGTITVGSLIFMKYYGDKAKNTDGDVLMSTKIKETIRQHPGTIDPIQDFPASLLFSTYQNANRVDIQEAIKVLGCRENIPRNKSSSIVRGIVSNPCYLHHEKENPTDFEQTLDRAVRRGPLHHLV